MNENAILREGQERDQLIEEMCQAACAERNRRFADRNPNVGACPEWEDLSDFLKEDTRAEMIAALEALERAYSIWKKE